MCLTLVSGSGEGAVYLKDLDAIIDLLIHSWFIKNPNFWVFLKIYFKWEDNCSTRLCWFLPYNSVNQPWVYYVPPSWTSLPPCAPLGCHRAPVWAPCLIQQISTGSLFCMWWCICFSAALSVHPTFSFTLCVHEFFMSVSLFLPYK